jgi:hypothetical protein
MDRAELARAIYAVSHRTGTFTLRSGATSHEYFDKYRFESDPALLHAIGEALAPLVPDGTEALGLAPDASGLVDHERIGSAWERARGAISIIALLLEELHHPIEGA